MGDRRFRLLETLPDLIHRIFGILVEFGVDLSLTLVLSQI